MAQFRVSLWVTKSEEFETVLEAPDADAAIEAAIDQAESRGWTVEADNYVEESAPDSIPDATGTP